MPRLDASWLAGANRMPWRRFLLWNTLGGTGWASTVGAAAYLLGRSASGSLGAIGFAGVAIAALVYLVSRIRRRLPALRYAAMWPVIGIPVLASLLFLRILQPAPPGRLSNGLNDVAVM